MKLNDLVKLASIAAVSAGIAGCIPATNSETPYDKVYRTVNAQNLGSLTNRSNVIIECNPSDFQEDSFLIRGDGTNAIKVERDINFSVMMDDNQMSPYKPTEYVEAVSAASKLNFMEKAKVFGFYNPAETNILRAHFIEVKGSMYPIYVKK